MHTIHDFRGCTNSIENCCSQLGAKKFTIRGMLSRTRCDGRRGKRGVGESFIKRGEYKALGCPTLSCVLCLCCLSCLLRTTTLCNVAIWHRRQIPALSTYDNARPVAKRSEVSRRLDSLVNPETFMLRRADRESVLKVLRLFNLCDLGFNDADEGKVKTAVHSPRRTIKARVVQNATDQSQVSCADCFAGIMQMKSRQLCTIDESLSVICSVCKLWVTQLGKQTTSFTQLSNPVVQSDAFATASKYGTWYWGVLGRPVLSMLADL